MHGADRDRFALSLGVLLMATLPAYAGFEATGQADPGAVIEVDRARITVLTPTLLRLEWAADKAFEDRPSMFAVQRELPVPAFKQNLVDGLLTVETDRLRLRYRPEGGRFNAANLDIQVLGTDQETLWKPGRPNAGNLGGTVRTLDSCRGPVDLGEGVLSRDGWYLLDDSARLLLDGDPVWPTPRPAGDRIDWYFFGYGLDYATALKDLTTVGGSIPLPPKFVFGSWYSRYWPYTSSDFLAIADGYRERGYPLDVMVIDIDWHLDGWTGYTWNRELIPDPPALLEALHERGLHPTLNLHPHEGVQAHEAAYADFARAMGVDPESKQTIPFDIADPKYMDAYFALLHHPLEALGVDFWWMDWQQQRTSKIPGLDPLPWLNQLHFYDRGREETGRRGLSFSRWGGWGDHRHPIQFSGDTESTWRVLKFLVPFTSTAGNVGAAYWSHDTGGHWSASGKISDELYARWLQLCAFTTTMRVHSTRDPENDRRPWVYGPEFERAARAAFDLRYRLLPYVYTMARRTYETGLPLCRPMYLHHPTEPWAYELAGQYYFGDDLIVAPVVEPGAGPNKVASAVVRLPEGDWYDLMTNVHYAGPGEYLVHTPLDRVPVFARGGRPLPMDVSGRLNTGHALDPLVVRVYPGPAGETQLYEDDGESPAYTEPGGAARTGLTFMPDDQGAAFELVVHPVEGAYDGLADARAVRVELCSVLPPGTIQVDGQEIPEGQPPADTPVWNYDHVTMTATVHLRSRPNTEPTVVRYVPVEGAAEVIDAQHWRFAFARFLVDYRAQTGGRTRLPVELQRVADWFTASGDLPASLEQVAGLEARVVAGMLRFETQRMATGGRQAPAMLVGAALSTELQDVDAGSARVGGELWLSRLPDRGQAAGLVRISASDKSVLGAPTRQQVSFTEPGRQAFAFDLQVPADRLVHITGTVRARLNWAGHPVSLNQKFTCNRSFVTYWHVAGPFAGGKGPKAATLGPEENPGLDQVYSGLNGRTVKWQPLAVPATDGEVRLLDIFGGHNVCAFAQAFLECEEDADVDLLLRHDDGTVVWVNGQEVYADSKPRALETEPTAFPVHLTKGVNTVLVKVDQLGGNWGLALHAQGRNGAALPVIRVLKQP